MKLQLETLAVRASARSMLLIYALNYAKVPRPLLICIAVRTTYFINASLTRHIDTENLSTPIHNNVTVFPKYSQREAIVKILRSALVVSISLFGTHNDCPHKLRKL